MFKKVFIVAAAICAAGPAAAECVRSDWLIPRPAAGTSTIDYVPYAVIGRNPFGAATFIIDVDGPSLQPRGSIAVVAKDDQGAEMPVASFAPASATTIVFHGTGFALRANIDTATAFNVRGHWTVCW